MLLIDTNPIKGARDSEHVIYLNNGLQINVRKTKVMRINTTYSTPIKPNGLSIDKICQFGYPGSVITTTGGTNDDISARINKARAVFGRLKQIWSSNVISIQTRIRVFKSCDLPVLLYGSDMRSYSSNDILRAQVFVNIFLRRILKLF